MIIAFYLPQYHRIEENDFWWGEGFTEWTHLARWKPQFTGHTIRRPHPDIGYYNLLDFSVRKKQAELAKQYGVDGFCYYHYWFNRKQLLNKPIDLMLKEGEPNLPFCFSWANEHWSRRWTGEWKDVLQWQTYGDKDEWQAHIDYLMPFFTHPNYIKIDNKPMFLIYHFFEVDRLHERLKFYDDECKKNGLGGIHLVNTYFASNWETFPRHSDVSSAVADFWPIRGNTCWPIVIDDFQMEEAGYAYREIPKQPSLCSRHYAGTFAGFDNTPRRGIRGKVYYGATPEMFGESLRAVLKKTIDGIVFINAWNEWGEQAILEPCDKWGYRFLEEVKKSVNVS